MGPSANTTSHRPALLMNTAEVIESGHSSTSALPLTLPKHGSSSVRHECKMHSIVPAPTSHQQDLPQYSDDHPAVLDFTKAYLKEAFDVECTNDLLAIENKKDEIYQPSFTPESPTETRKWFKRSKPEPKSPATRQFDYVGDVASKAAPSDLNNPNLGPSLVKSIIQAPTPIHTTPESTSQANMVTSSNEKDKSTELMPVSGRKLSIPCKIVDLGNPKVIYTKDSPEIMEDISSTAQDNLDKENVKDKMANDSEEHIVQAATAEKSTALGRDGVRKGKGKTKSKRAKAKSAKSKTGAENPQSSQNTINIGKGKETDGTPNKAPLDKENFIVSKVNEIREKTDTQIVWYKKGDAPCAHPNHPRVWNSKNLWCGGGHRGLCARCKAPCCIQNELTMRLKNEDLPPSDREPARKMLEGITLWCSAGSEESTFMECTECHKFFCPGCVSVCPLCLDRMCHDCNSVEPWTACELHGDY